MFFGFGVFTIDLWGRELEGHFGVDMVIELMEKISEIRSDAPTAWRPGWQLAWTL